MAVGSMSSRAAQALVCGEHEFTSVFVCGELGQSAGTRTQGQVQGIVHTLCFAEQGQSRVCGVQAAWAEAPGTRSHWQASCRVQANSQTLCL